MGRLRDGFPLILERMTDAVYSGNNSSVSIMMDCPNITADAKADTPRHMPSGAWFPQEHLWMGNGAMPLLELYGFGPGQRS